MNKSTFLGTVQDVNGTAVRVILANESLSGLTYVDGQGYRIGQVGSFVKIPIGYINLYGIVNQIGASAVPENQLISQPYGNRWLSIQLIGECNSNGKFERGISQYPTIDDEVHLVSETDLRNIYGKHQEKYYVKVGHISGADSIPALIDINKLLTRHSAIVGTTGSGKSTTVAGILTALSNPDYYKSSRILVLDIHGEYSKALRDRSNIFKISPDVNSGEKQLLLPYWALNFDEFISLAFGELDPKDKGALAEKIYILKKKSLKNHSFIGVTEDNLSVDTPIPFSVHKLWLYFHRLVFSTHNDAGTNQKFEEIDQPFVYGQTSEDFLLDENKNPIQLGDAENIIPPLYTGQVAKKVYLSASTLNLRRPLDSLASKLRDPRFNFLFKPGNWKPDIEGTITYDLDSLFKEWIGSNKPISIIDLSGVPISILNSIIGILLRLIYDFLFWARDLSQGGKNRPLLIVMEEAHNYLNDDFKGLASSIVQRVVKEGRKYGIGAMIVSQRPSEINSTILSQCGTFFALRLSNSTDRGHITSAISDNLEGLTNMLPILKTGEAIIIGEAVQLPMRTNIHAPEKDRRPDSQDPIVYEVGSPFESLFPGGWGIPMEIDPKYDELIQAWRAQNPKIVSDSKKQSKKDI